MLTRIYLVYISLISSHFFYKFLLISLNWLSFLLYINHLLSFQIFLKFFFAYLRLVYPSIYRFFLPDVFFPSCPFSLPLYLFHLTSFSFLLNSSPLCILILFPFSGLSLLIFLSLPACFIFLSLSLCFLSLPFPSCPLLPLLV